MADERGIDGMREGEVASSHPLSADATLTFIGVIGTPWRTRTACPKQGDPDQGPPCRLILSAQWAEALDGVDAHEHLQVLYWMDAARRDLLRLVPRGGKPRGPFALRAPTRPNPIASSIVRLLAREDLVLTVRGLDCLDGTPLLDIKPWRD